MTEKKQLFLNLFEMACVSHITHGLWPLPGNNRHRFDELSYWLELAQLLEHGGFDGVFLADVVGAYDDQASKELKREVTGYTVQVQIAQGTADSDTQENLRKDHDDVVAKYDAFRAAAACK